MNRGSPWNTTAVLIHWVTRPGRWLVVGLLIITGSLVQADDGWKAVQSRSKPARMSKPTPDQLAPPSLEPDAPRTGSWKVRQSRPIVASGTRPLPDPSIVLVQAIDEQPPVDARVAPPESEDSLPRQSDATEPTRKSEDSTRFNGHSPTRFSKPGFGIPSENSAALERETQYVLDRVHAELTLDVQLGRPVILRLKKAPFRDQVADPETVDVLNLTETEYSITGKKVGATVLNYWFENPDVPGGHELVSYLVRVLDDPETTQRFEALLNRLENDINRAFPNSAVRLTYVGNQVVVRGQAKDIEEATQILRIVAGSLPKADQAEAPFDPKQFFIDGVDLEQIDEAGGVTGLTQGQTATGANGTRINNRIVNMLEIGGLHQVMLKVTVAEVNRSAIRAIGADLEIGDPLDTSFFTLLPLPGAGGAFLVNRDDFSLAINALKSINLARSLAEPNLVTLNGQPANFQVGGQFPVPSNAVVAGAGAQGGVEFIPFGIRLNFTPTVTDHDRIRLNLQATVSTRDESTGAVIADSEVAGLNNRNFQTTVELREGQTIAIAGLVQSNLGGSTARVPVLGDIPILGRLFSSDSTSYDEQELIVLVTPYLVNPLEATREPLPLPGSDYFEPDDFEFFLRGSLTGHIAEDFRTPARTDFDKIRAFRCLEQDLIIGQPGHSNGLRCPAPAKAPRPQGGKP